MGSNMDWVWITLVFLIARSPICQSFDVVVCDREKDYWDWWWDSTEYFTCDHNQFCCGDAWNRKCCDKV